MDSGGWNMCGLGEWGWDDVWIVDMCGCWDGMCGCVDVWICVDWCGLVWIGVDGGDVGGFR